MPLAPTVRRARRRTAGLLLALASPLAAQAIAPGLWEHSMQSGGANPMAGMQAQMASLPPEQRKQMEAMMASRGVAMGGTPGSVQMCITVEQIAKGELGRTEKGCTHQVLERSATRMRSSFECAGPPPSKGEADYTITGEKAYSGRIRITQGSGPQAKTMDMATSGRWIQADCGALKPSR